MMKLDLGVPSRPALGFVLLFVVVFYFVSPSSKHHIVLQSKTESGSISRQRAGEVSADYDFSSTLERYLEARKSGLPHPRVAKEVFNVTFPHLDGERMHSYPFFSGDTISTNTWLGATIEKLIVSPVNVRHHDGDIFFVKTDWVTDFARSVVPRIRHRFILITHNSDYEVPRGNLTRKLLDNPKLIKWFAANAGIFHPKLVPLPLGLENQHWHKAGELKSLTKLFMGSRTPPVYDPEDKATSSARPANFLVNFSTKTNILRFEWLKAFARMGYTPPTEKKDQVGFWQDIMRTKFVVSPPGNGEDCHRTWESIIMGAIPIVRNSTLWPLWKQLPVYVVNELSELSEDAILNYRLSDDLRKHGKKLMLAQYWMDIITETKLKARREEELKKQTARQQ